PEPPPCPLLLLHQCLLGHISSLSSSKLRLRRTFDEPGGPQVPSLASLARTATPLDPHISSSVTRGDSRLAREREAQRAQQGARLLVVWRRGHHGDVHPPDLHDLVVVDLLEYQLLRHPDRI